MSAKLYFRYGTVNSAKTMNLLAVAHSYDTQSKKCFLIKQEKETRFGGQTVGSRAGSKRLAELTIDETYELTASMVPSGTECILVDEVQFFTCKQIDALRKIVVELDVPVIAYGLRTDFKTQLFEGSKRLMEIADCIEEVKTICSICNRKAIISAKVDKNNNLSISGDQLLITLDAFKPMCAKCFYSKLNINGLEIINGLLTKYKEEMYDSETRNSQSEGVPKMEDKTETEKEVKMFIDGVEVVTIDKGAEIAGVSVQAMYHHLKTYKKYRLLYNKKYYVAKEHVMLYKKHKRDSPY